jgi:carbonic anhydrase
VIAEFHHVAEGNNTLLVSNNGHTLKFDFPAETVGQNHLSGGALSGNYILEQAHLHWGLDANDGSEHAIAGEKFPVEIHFVHRSDDFGSLTEAAASGMSDAVAVVGIMFEIGEENSALQAVFDSAGFSDIIHADSSYQIEVPMELSHFLPADTADYYQYTGSFTTPGCNEVVSWHVLYSALTISEAQLEELYGLHDHSGEELGAIFRELQPLNDRTVRTNVNVSYFIEPLDDMGDKLEEASIIFFAFSIIGACVMYVVVNQAANDSKKAQDKKMKTEQKRETSYAART